MINGEEKKLKFGINYVLTRKQYLMFPIDVGGYFVCIQFFPAELTVEGVAASNVVVPSAVREELGVLERATIRQPGEYWRAIVRQRRQKRFTVRQRTFSNPSIQTLQV